MRPTAGRIRFEIRVLSVGGVETFYFDDAAVRAEPLPKVGETAGPLLAMAGWRRVVSVDRFGERGTRVVLEPIDCSQLEREYDAEVAALREAGWRT